MLPVFFMLGKQGLSWHSQQSTNTKQTNRHRTSRANITKDKHDMAFLEEETIGLLIFILLFLEYTDFNFCSSIFKEISKQH